MQIFGPPPIDDIPQRPKPKPEPPDTHGDLEEDEQ